MILLPVSPWMIITLSLATREIISSVNASIGNTSRFNGSSVTVVELGDVATAAFAGKNEESTLFHSLTSFLILRMESSSEAIGSPNLVTFSFFETFLAAGDLSDTRSIAGTVASASVAPVASLSRLSFENCWKSRRSGLEMLFW